MLTRTIVVLLAGISGVTLALVFLWRRRLHRTHRLRVEDALKALLTAQLENRVLGAPGLAGLIGVRYETTIRLIEQMHAAGLVCWGPAGLELTPTGRRAAVRLLRAHRLTERFLVDEARMAVERVHAEADRAEHAMTETQLAELNEFLGHPDWDPHGDPIPDARGHVAHSKRHQLDTWRRGRRAIVAHVEDEPPHALRRLLALGLRPGAALEVIARGKAGLTVRVGTTDVHVSFALARQVHVRPWAVDVAAPQGAGHALAELAIGCHARIVRLQESCRGFTRRRLLDLGITPGALIRPETANAGGSARAYRIRDTVIVLRREQAEQIIVEEVARSSGARTS